MPDDNFPWTKDRMDARARVIRHRNLALALVLGFFVLLFFAITVVKMRHMQMPKKPLVEGSAGAGAGAAPGAVHAQ